MRRSTRACAWSYSSLVFARRLSRALRVKSFNRNCDQRERDNDHNDDDHHDHYQNSRNSNGNINSNYSGRAWAPGLTDKCVVESFADLESAKGLGFGMWLLRQNDLLHILLVFLSENVASLLPKLFCRQEQQINS